MEMTSRERVRLALEHKEADRVAIQDGPWGTTIARWHKEGLPENVGPHEYFHYEFASIGADISLRIPTEKLEETDEHIVQRGANGAVHRNWKGKTSTPELVDFTIKSRRDWDEHKGKLKYDESRLNWENAKKAHENARAKGLFLTFGGGIGYDHNSAGLLGPVRLLTAIVEEPDWVKEIFMMQADLTVQIVEELFARGLDFDAAFYYDDLGYRNGLFFSPRAFREVLQPAHRRYLEPFKRRGLPCILHSCGNVTELVPDLLDSGWTCLQPLEVKAGMDLIGLKKKYGDVLAFMGGIDVRKMAAAEEHPEALEEEIRTKVRLARKGGGYIYHSDHSVPDNVSFASYQRVIELVRKHGAYRKAKA
jgi:uroporphyrinogen decarboxylase